MELVLIRHFATPGNAKGQYIGSTDEPLDESKIPQKLLDYPEITGLAASPMIRCIQTAGIIYPGYEPILCPKLRELDFGEYECKTYEELKNEPAYQRWIDSGGLGAFPGGEDRMDFQKRCLEGMQELVGLLKEKQKSDKLPDMNQNSQTSCTALVVHGGTIMVLMSAYSAERRAFYDWQVRNGEGYQVGICEEALKEGQIVFRNIRELKYETSSGEKQLL